MRQISATTQARLDTGELVLRDFVWIGARLRSNGQLASRGWWSDVGTVTAQVPDANNVLRTRTYIGNGDLVGVAAVPMVLGLTAQSVTIDLAVMSDAVEEAVREWDVRFAPVEIHRGVIDPVSMLMPEPALRRCAGFVDYAEISTPAEGEDATISLKCANKVQETLRSNSAKRSHADQQLRSLGDTFYRHTAVVGKWKIKWFDGDKT